MTGHRDFSWKCAFAISASLLMTGCVSSGLAERDAPPRVIAQASPPAQQTTQPQSVDDNIFLGGLSKLFGGRDAPPPLVGAPAQPVVAKAPEQPSKVEEKTDEQIFFEGFGKFFNRLNGKNVDKPNPEAQPQSSAPSSSASAAPPPPADDGLLGGISRIFKPKESEVAKEDIPAGRLYNEGLVLLNQNRFRAASLRFEELDRAHPHSEWAKKSLLLIAYAQYRAGEYDNAAGAADRFLALHPGSDDAPYAKFILGDSYYRQIPDIARDQAGSERAIAALRDLIQRYPTSEYARAAEQRMLVANDQLAGKEMDIGRFYLKQKSYGGAAGRFKLVVQKFQTTRHVEEALYRLVECYLALGIVEEAQTAASVLGHNYPDSEWYKDAFKLLDRDGLQPQDNDKSWITQALKSITG